MKRLLLWTDEASPQTPTTTHRIEWVYDAEGYGRPSYFETITLFDGVPVTRARHAVRPNPPNERGVWLEKPAPVKMARQR